MDGKCFELERGGEAWIRRIKENEKENVRNEIR